MANLVAQGIDVGGTGQAFGFDEKTGLTAGQTVDEAYRQDVLQQDQDNFEMGLLGQGIDTREFVGAPGGRMVRNPQYGLPYGFDPKTGLTAGQQTQADQFDITQTFAEKQFDELSAGDLANLAAQGIDQNETITRQNPYTGVWETVANPNFGRPIGFDAATGLSAGETLDEAYRQDVLTADATAAEQAQENFLAEMVAQGIDMSEDGTGLPMGFDATEFVEDKNEASPTFGEQVKNPTYGMTAMQQANYALALQEARAATGTEINTTTNLMNHLATLGDPNFTSAVLQEIRGVIDSAPGMVTKGMTDANVLHALGELSQQQAPDGTYPYRDMFTIVQGMELPETPPPPEPPAVPEVDTGATNLSASEMEETAADAFIRGVETGPENLPTGQRAQGTRHPRPAGAFITPQSPVYSDTAGNTFSQADLDRIEADMPQGGPDAPWLDPAYEPGVVGYIDWAAQVGYVFDREWDMGTQSNVLVTGVARERA